MRVSGRGQITIPKELRERLGLVHNVEVDIRSTDDGIIIRRKDAEQPGAWSIKTNDKLTPRSRAAIRLMDERIKAGVTGVDAVAGILEADALGEGVTVDDFIEEIRGR